MIHFEDPLRLPRRFGTPGSLPSSRLNVTLCPKRDCAELHRRRNKLSCPQTSGEISRYRERRPRQRDDVLRRPRSAARRCRRATFPHRVGQRLQSRLRHQIRMRRDRTIRQFDLRGRFGALFPGKGHAHCFDFLQSDCRSATGRALPRSPHMPPGATVRDPALYNERRCLGELRRHDNNWRSTLPVQ